MSKLQEELLAEEGFWADFDVLASQEKWSEAEALMQYVGDRGHENLALRMHQTLNRLNPDLVYIPMEDNDHPILTPEEDDAPVSNPPQVGTVWTREGDEKFPETI